MHTFLTFFHKNYFQEPFDKDLLAKMEAGNKKLYSKDMTSIALTTQHKRGIVGAFVEGRIKLPNTTNRQQSTTSTSPSNQTQKTGRGGNQSTGRGGRGGRGGKSGRGGRGGGGRGGTAKKPSQDTNEDSQPKAKQPRGAQGQHSRGEQLPTKSKKKLVDKIKDPHVQAIIRDQLDQGDSTSFCSFDP